MFQIQFHIIRENILHYLFTLFTLLKFNKIFNTKRFNNNILFYKIMYYNFTFLPKCITNGKFLY